MTQHLLRFSAIAVALGLFLALTGCLYDHAPSDPVRSIDSWLIGQWATQDKSGHAFKAIVAPASSDHYKVSFQRGAAEELKFDGWISRVDGFSILVLKSLNQGNTFGKYALYHYELLTPSAPLPGGIGAPRIRLSELQLDESTRSLDAFKLRAAIRSALKAGTLLTPYDVASSRKGELIEQKINDLTSSTAAGMAGIKDAKISEATQKSLELLGKQKMELLKDVPGSIVWTRTGGVTLKGETF